MIKGVHLSGSPNDGVAKTYTFVKSTLPKKFPDQFSPFLSYDFNPTKPFNGTLLRIPLRNHVNPHSLSQKQYEVPAVLKLFENFKPTAASCLVFLSHLEKISSYLISEDTSSSLELLYEFSARPQVHSQISKVRGQRDFLPHLNWKGFKIFGFNPILHNFSLDIAVKDKKKEHVERWLICHTLGSGNSRNMAFEKDLTNFNLIPIGGVATPVNLSHEVSFDGSLCCGLPIQTVSINMFVILIFIRAEFQSCLMDVLSYRNASDNYLPILVTNQMQQG